MKKAFFVFLIALMFVGISNMFAQPIKSTLYDLMPVPAGPDLGRGKHYINEDFKVMIKGDAHPRLHKAVRRMMKRLAGRTGFWLEQVHFDPKDQDRNASFLINVRTKAKIKLGQDESYTLLITPDIIELNAKNDLGIMHGMETFLQLLDADEKGYFVPVAEIMDAPRFPWRGLLIDACRHFMPVDVIKRNLDGMAAVKLNVLHWHLSEDQGFRVECKTFPKLHKLGSDGQYYAQEEIKDIIQYAADRGIRVVPEFDVPGHATSWLVGYPELASAPGPYQIERGFGVFDPTFNPAIDETYDFFEEFFEEMADLFPDEYMHIGGDENNGKQWDANPDIQKFMKKKDIPDNHALQSYFNNKLLKILTKLDKKMMGWDEILHEDMPNNIVIQSWRGKEAMVKSAQEGYQTLLSNGYYIDLVQPASFHYLNDPSPSDLPLTAEQRKNILGGEATMWAELISPETVDSRIWPRTAAIAERLWSPEFVKDVDDMYRRLEIISYQLEELGLTHNKNYPYMLRRLTNNNDIASLKTLVDVIEPIKKYKRHRVRKHYTYTPLTRVVDAAQPDAKVARDFNNLVMEFLKDIKNDEVAKQLKSHLQIWQTNHEKLIPIIEISPVLKEIEPMSLNLLTTSNIGLEAIAFIEQNNKPDETWIKTSDQNIIEAREQQGMCELMIVDGIYQLVEKAKNIK